MYFVFDTLMEGIIMHCKGLLMEIFKSFWYLMIDSKQCRPTWDAVFGGISSESILVANSLLGPRHQWAYIFMGESFQDYSWIQDFEADFPQKVSLKMLNLAEFNSFFDLFSVHLWAIDHLNLKLLTLCRYTASFKIWILKVQDFWNYVSGTKTSLSLYIDAGHVLELQIALTSYNQRADITWHFTCIYNTSEMYFMFKIWNCLWYPYLVNIQLYFFWFCTHQTTAMVIFKHLVHLITLFPRQAWLSG